MPPTAVELLDGTSLVWFDRPEPDALRQLEAWALVPEATDDDPSRNASVWKDALDAGPLLYVAFSGVVGNAAWAVFPAAARFVLARRQVPAATVDAARVASRAREAVAATAGLTESDVSMKEVSRKPDGTWRVRMSLTDSRTAQCRFDHDAVVVQVRVD